MFSFFSIYVVTTNENLSIETNKDTSRITNEEYIDLIEELHHIYYISHVDTSVSDDSSYGYGYIEFYIVEMSNRYCLHLLILMIPIQLLRNINMVIKKLRFFRRKNCAKQFPFSWEGRLLQREAILFKKKLCLIVTKRE